MTGNCEGNKWNVWVLLQISYGYLEIMFEFSGQIPIFAFEAPCCVFILQARLR